MLSIVCWKWRPIDGYRSRYTDDTVNILRRMVARHYPDPHRFICVTDQPGRFHSDVEVVPLWNDFADLPHPQNPMFPSCYRRLRAFAPDIEAVFGKRFVSLDLDTVICDDMRPVWNRPEDFVIWGDTNPQPGSHYNGGMVLMTAGARKGVWEQFDPKTSPKKAFQARCWGSDQGWISYYLGPGETKWSKLDGVYSYRNDLKTTGGRLPSDARIVLFHGAVDPWSPCAQRLDWVRTHWC